MSPGLPVVGPPHPESHYPFAFAPKCTSRAIAKCGIQSSLVHCSAGSCCLHGSRVRRDGLRCAADDPGTKATIVPEFISILTKAHLQNPLTANDPF